jgi:hypothetical protein
MGKVVDVSDVVGLLVWLEKARAHVLINNGVQFCAAGALSYRRAFSFVRSDSPQNRRDKGRDRARMVNDKCRDNDWSTLRSPFPWDESTVVSRLYHRKHLGHYSAIHVDVLYHFPLLSPKVNDQTVLYIISSCLPFSPPMI